MDSSRDLGGKFTINNKIFPIYGGINTVGRNKEAIVNIKSLNISQHHAIFILVDDDLHFISDLKSSNGTFLNDEPLAALQLYRIKNGARIKFADIEGTYSQCCSENAKFNSLNESQYTQNYTQSFYRTDTQLLEDSSINQNDKTLRTQNSTYIPTQLLMNVTNALEKSYEKIHEVPTQLVVGSKYSDEVPTEKLNLQVNSLIVNEKKNSVKQEVRSKSTYLCQIDQSLIDLHEAETQKVTLDEKYEILKGFEMSTNGLENVSNIHEMETQLIPPEEKESQISNNTLEIISKSSHINNETPNLELNVREQIGNNIENKVELALLSDRSETISEDSDLIKPLGISRNIIASQHLLNVDSSNSSSDTFRQLKKTMTFESSISEHDNNREIQVEGSNDSIDFMTMQKVADIENNTLKNGIAKVDNLLDKHSMLGNEVKDNDSESQIEENCGHDSVNPVGLSRNIIASQNSFDESISDTDSDIIRPVKKTLFVFPETPTDKYNNSEEMMDEDSNDSLDFMTMQRVVNIEEKTFRNNCVVCNENEDNINDSHTCVNKRKGNTFEDNSNTIASVFNAQKNQNEKVSDSETDIENDTIEKKYSPEVVSQTDVEENVIEENTSEKKNFVTGNEKLIKGELITIDKHENISEKTSGFNGKNVDEITDANGDTKKSIRKKVSLSRNQKNNMNLRRKKRNQSFIDSETETETDTDITDVNIINSFKNNHDEKNSKDRICEVIHSSTLNDTTSQDEVKLIDKTRTEEGILNSSVDLKVKLTDIPSKETEGGKEMKVILPINESLNDSDIIPATQEIAPMRSISQNTNFENSEESFRLGLTQLMEDNVDEKGYSQKNNSSTSNMAGMNNTDHIKNLETIVCDNSQQMQKKFTFKKKHSSDTTERVNITLDDDDEIYKAETQNLCKETVDSRATVKDDHVFLEPTQKLTKKNVSSEKAVPEEEIYILCTQKMDGSSSANDIDDIYLQSTQKLNSENFNNHLDGKNKMCSNWQGNTQYNEESAESNIKTIEHTSELSNENDDLNDMFATQTIIPKMTPKKNLERELEFMFATQKSIPTEESLDKIQHVIFQTPIDNSKLPEGDSDLEAILATQKYPDSPKTSKLHKNTDVDQIIITGRSIESQLEVLFHSQRDSLSSEKNSRPVNPLVNILGKETQETEPMLSEESNIDNSKAMHEEISVATENKHSENTTGCSKMKNKISSQIAIEQSFALLEAKSTKIRRSARNTNYEDVTVSCSKSRKSLIIAPNEKFEKVLEAECKLNKEKKRRTAIKRQSPTSSDLNNETKVVKPEEVIKKKRKASENLTLEADAFLNKLSSSSRLTRTKRGSKFLENIDDHKSDFEKEETSSKRSKNKLEQKNITSEKILNNKRSSRQSRKYVEGDGNSDINDTGDKVSKSMMLSKKQTSRDSHNENNKNNPMEERSTKQQETSSITNKQKLTTSDSSSSAVDENQSSGTLNTDCAFTVSTPSKTRKRPLAITPSIRESVLEYQDSPSRSKRKQKTKVVFTMIKDPKLESAIKLLGGTVVDSVDTCTVLITPSIKRSMKLLSAVGLGKPICSIKWIEDSKKKNQFLDPWDYLLIDKEAETKWEFSLKTSLERSLLAKLFEGYSFQLLVKTALDVLKGAIESCGGKIVTRTPKETKNFIVVALPEEELKYKKLLKLHPHLNIVEPEAIFDGVLRQEIRFERHLLNV